MRNLRLAALLFVALTAAAQTPPPPSILRLPEQPTISLSPAVVMARGQFGQTLTQTLTLTNHTPNAFSFQMVANDVVVRDGKRVFVPAGNLEDSVAQSAVFSQKSGTVPAESSASVDVRLTIPKATAIRAVAVIFQGTQVVSSQNSVGMIGSLGALVTFNLTDDVKVDAGPVKVTVDSSSSVSITETLSNSGSEPAVVEGVAALLDAQGKLVGKVPFDSQRLLPGERLQFSADYPTALPPGKYRVLCSFAFEGKQLTTSANLQIG